MAFIPPTAARTTTASTHKPRAICIRHSSFLQSTKSFQPSWSNALLPHSHFPLTIQSPSALSMQVAPPQIIISGAPASGKGTQCEYIVQKYGVVHLSTGDMLRSAVKSGAELGMEAKGYMDSGNLVPDDLVISMLKERIVQSDCVRNGWLLDGFPRTIVQAQALDQAGIVPSAVVLLNVEDDALIERVVGRRSDPETGKIYHVKFSPPTDPEVENRLVQRSDDTEEKARVRLNAYYTHSQSIQDHYSKLLQCVDGNRAKVDIFGDIAAVIDDSVSKESDNDDHSGPGSGTTASASASLSAVAATTDSSPENASTKSIPVAEFVRRAEEAYEKGVLLDQDVNWSGQAGADGPDAAGSSSYADLARRVDLVIGDVLSFLMFAYIGRATHGDKSLDFDVLKTAAPFITAWLVTSPLLGAYTREATMNVPSALKFFVRSWALAVPLGIGLRGVLTDHVPPALFAVITLASTFVITGSWRVLYVKVRGDETDEARRGGFIDGFRMVTTLLRRW